MKHTETPWNWHGPYLGGDYKVSALDENDAILMRVYVSGENAKHDAAHIVRCVNAFPELVAALEKSAQRIEQLCSTCNTLSNKLGLGDKVHAEDFADVARAAIAKARA